MESTYEISQQQEVGEVGSLLQRYLESQQFASIFDGSCDTNRNFGYHLSYKLLINLAASVQKRSHTTFIEEGSATFPENVSGGLKGTFSNSKVQYS